MRFSRQWFADYRPDLFGIGVVFIAVLVLFTPMLTQMLWGRGFDYPLHLEFVKAYREGNGKLLAHPLFHLSVLAVLPLLPPLPFLETYKQAGLLVGMGLYLLTALVLYAVYARPMLKSRPTYKRALFAVTVTILLMLLAPVNIFSWREGHLYWGYFLSNIHMNPTLTALKPFALLLFVYVVGAFSTHPHFKTWLAALLAAALTVLATFAKPNYTILFAPVILLVASLRLYRKQPVNWRLIIFGLLLPAAVSILVQMFGFSRPLLNGGAILFRPFEMLTERGIQNIPLKFVMSILFPLAVYLSYWRHARRDLALNLAWLIFLLGAFVSYCFIEQNRIGDGNFVWSGQVAITVLFAASMLFFLREHHAAGGGFTRPGVICMLVLSLHGLSGVFWYYADMVSPGFVWY